MVKEGTLPPDVPVVGVSSSGLDATINCASGPTTSIASSLGSEPFDADAFNSLIEPADVRLGRLSRRRDVRQPRLCNCKAATIRCSTWRSRRRCSKRSCKGSPGSVSTRARASSSRSRSVATCSPRRSSTRSCTRRSPSRRCSASTTSSARNRSRTCWCSASPTRCSSRSGTATSSTRSRSRWPRSFDVQGRGKFYDSVGALRDVVQNHLLEIVALLAMEPPSNAIGDRAARREGQGVPPGRDVQARSGGARAVPRLRRRRRRAARLRHGDVPRVHASRSSRGVGPACRG